MKVKNLYYQHVKKKLGDERNTRFWEDWWVGSKPLKEAYPILYNVSFDHNISVAEAIENGWHKFSFRKKIDWRYGAKAGTVLSRPRTSGRWNKVGELGDILQRADLGTLETGEGGVEEGVQSTGGKEWEEIGRRNRAAGAPEPRGGQAGETVAPSLHR